MGRRGFEANTGRWLSARYRRGIALLAASARWRQELKQLKRDKLIVFFGNHYGIFAIPVFLTLTGVPFYLPPEFGSLDDILTRFGMLQE
jgi:hypothetical protein